MQASKREKEISFGRIDATIVGEGPVVIFVHGGLLNRELFAHQLAALSKDYTCIAIDLPGFGTSRAMDLDFSLENLAAELANFIAELDQAPIRFFGVSLGACITLKLAKLAPEMVSSLVLCSCSTLPGSNGRATKIRKLLQQEGMESISKMFATTMLAGDPEKTQRGKVEEMARNTPIETALKLFQLIDVFPDLSADLISVPHPILLMAGDSDPIIDPEYQQYLANRAVNCKRVEISNSGHLAVMTHPDQVNRAVKAFWASC